MNWLDIFIIVFLFASVVRGLEVGFVRQFFSTFGFFAGAFIGLWLQDLLIHIAKSPEAKSLLVLLVVLGCALGFMTAGEYAGMRIKFKLRESRITERLDGIFGSALSAITLLAVIWMGAALLRNLPFDSWQRQISDSRIIGSLNTTLPSAPELLTRIGHLIDPNGFPHVFSTLEPKLPTDMPLPDMGELNAAIIAARPSIVKVEGEGCGGIVVGSGFMAGSGLVITNAHVIAGVRQPFIIDQAGQHRTSVMYFDPGLDIAILRAETSKAKPLSIRSEQAPNGTAVATAGYPGNAGFTATPGVIMETFTAYGRNIYDTEESIRTVYSIKTAIEKGNSGGPILDKDGNVVGVIFGKSYSYDQVGYALTGDQTADALTKAQTQNRPVSTGACAE